MPKPSLLLAASLLVSAPAVVIAASPEAAPAAIAERPRVSAVSAGAIADGKTVNTAALQSAIDGLAAQGGGTLVFPAGVFLSGALDLRPGIKPAPRKRRGSPRRLHRRRYPLPVAHHPYRGP